MATQGNDSPIRGLTNDDYLLWHQFAERLFSAASAQGLPADNELISKIEDALNHEWQPGQSSTEWLQRAARRLGVSRDQLSESDDECR